MKVQVKVNGRLGPTLMVPDNIKAEDIQVDVIEGAQTHEVIMTWAEIPMDEGKLNYFTAKEKKHA